MKLRNPQSGWKPNSSILKIIRCSVIVAYIGLSLLSVLSLMFNHGGFLNNYYVCSKAEPPEYKTGLSVTAILVLGFLLLAILSSVTLDFFSFIELWKLESKRPKIIVTQPSVEPENTTEIPELPRRKEADFQQCWTRKILDEMPLRSSLINTIFLIFYIFIMVALGVIGRNFSKQENLTLLGIPYFIMSIFRTWFVSTLTFKKNDSNRQRDRDQEREKLRKKEIHFALKARQARLEAKANIFTIRVRPQDCDCDGICSLGH